MSPILRLALSIPHSLLPMPATVIPEPNSVLSIPLPPAPIPQLRPRIANISHNSSENSRFSGIAPPWLTADLYGFEASGIACCLRTSQRPWGTSSTLTFLSQEIPRRSRTPQQKKPAPFMERAFTSYRGYWLVVHRAPNASNVLTQANYLAGIAVLIIVPYVQHHAFTI